VKTTPFNLIVSLKGPPRVSSTALPHCECERFDGGAENLGVVARVAEDETRRSQLTSMNSYFHWVFWRESIDESPPTSNN
jgi:hypothetical protein